MRQTDLLSWDESTCTAPPQVIINVVSCDILQLSVTKTALKVYSNLAQVSCSLVAFLVSFFFLVPSTFPIELIDVPCVKHNNDAHHWHEAIHAEISCALTVLPPSICCGVEPMNFLQIQQGLMVYSTFLSHPWFVHICCWCLQTLLDQVSLLI